MFNSIPAFSLVLFTEGGKFTTESLERRRQDIREEIHLLAPATKHLLHSVLVETVVVEKNQLELVYELIPSSQLCLEFNSTDSTNRLRVSREVIGLMEDLNRIRESAEFTQIKLLELAQYATTIAKESSDGGDALYSLSNEDNALMKWMLSRKDKVRKISFREHDIHFQIPLFPAFIPENFTRGIRAIINTMSRRRAELTVISEIDEFNLNAESNRPKLPKRMMLHKPIDGSKSYFWSLIYAAMDNQIPLEAEVKVALQLDTLKPGYLELHGVLNLERLNTGFNLLKGTVMEGFGR